MNGRSGPSGALANQIREFEAVRDFFTSASIIAVTDLLFMGVFIFVLWHLVGIIVFVPIAAVVAGAAHHAADPDPARPLGAPQRNCTARGVILC